MTRFDPDSWRNAATGIDRISQDFQRVCDPALDPPQVALGGSPVDATIERRWNPHSTRWFHLIGGIGAKLDSDASKMRATARNYDAVEDNNLELAQRYWE